jgi:predicted anti-sigma-YlaC factor YlaD
MTDHVSREILQLMADSELPDEAVRTARHHLDHCESCRRKYQSLAHFDRLLRAMSVDSLPGDFANRVLVRLGIQPRAPSLFKVFGHFASLVTVVLVAALGGTVWAVLALPASDGSENQVLGRVQPLDAAGKWMETSWGEFTQWMQRALLLLPQTQAAKIFLMIILTAFVVAVVDRVVQRRGAAGRP